MKINMIMPTVDLSGGVRVMAIYAERLKRKGHDVTCISCVGRPPSLNRKIRSFLRGRGWPANPRPVPSHMDSIDVTHHVLSPWHPIRDADVPDGDVVIATWWETAEWVNGLSASKGAKAYLIQHDESLFDGVPPERARATWRMPLHKITISKWLTDMARDVYGDSTASHVPNSVDTDQFHAPPRGRQAKPTVGMLYSTTRFKGCEVSLEAIARAAKIVPGLRVVAFSAENVNPKLPLPDFAEIHYRPAQNAIKDLYAKCDVWLCGSRSEGFHLPPLEAMACRCPVVSTKVGGSMDAIQEGVNGHLVEVGDAAALADRLVHVLKLPEQDWREMSDAALATATRYSWDDAADRFEAALVTAQCRSKSGVLESVPQYGLEPAAQAV
jgi:glycosyltransferase involved in cell wall biosynthesis